MTEFDGAAAAEAVLAEIMAVAGDFALDEHLGDTGERFETILWLASRGTQGRDWGVRGPAPDALGGLLEGEDGPVALRERIVGLSQ